MTRLLSTYLQKYALFPVFTEEEVEHYLMPVEDVVDSYVVESAGMVKLVNNPSLGLSYCRGFVTIPSVHM